MVARASSVPVCGEQHAQSNPFYSERIQREIQIRAARPLELPAVPSSDGEELLPVENADDVGIERGRKPVVTGKGRGNQQGNSAGHGLFTTPPSKVSTPAIHPAQREDHRQVRTEGPMPPSAGEDVDMSCRQQQPDDLERAVEGELVNYLQNRNQQLEEELRVLRQRQGMSDGSSPWSTVGVGDPQSGIGCETNRDIIPGVGQSSRMRHGSPRRDQRRRMASRSPRPTQRLGVDHSKFTPNGTRVPEGPPPDSPVAEPCHAFTSGQSRDDTTGRDDMDVLGNYVHCTMGKSGGKLGDRSWKPRGSEPRPMEDQGLNEQPWEQQVSSLNEAMMFHPTVNMPWFQKPEHERGLQPAAAAAAAASLGPADRRCDRTGSSGQDHGQVHSHALFRGDRAGRYEQGHHPANFQGDRAGNHGGFLGARARMDEVTRRGDPWDLGGEGPLSQPHPAVGGRSRVDPVQEDQWQRSLNDINVRNRSTQNERYRRDLAQFYRHEQGYGYGDPRLPPDHPASAYWVPPPGGGQDIDLVDSPSPGSPPTNQPPPPPVSWMTLESGGGVGNSKAELPELMKDASPLQLGDWLVMCEPVLRDISGVSAVWWEKTVKAAKDYYQQWKTSSPLQRVQITPHLPAELQEAKYQRTEVRGVHLLLKALPTDLQEALVSSRELTSTAIVYRVLVRYQPGGSAEKQLLLNHLLHLPQQDDIKRMVTDLRSWRRHYKRAIEIGTSLPDGTLLLKTLEGPVLAIAEKDAQASFRIATCRSQLGVDERPTQDAIWQFSQMLLAEAETIDLMTAAVNSTPTKIPKIKAMDTPTSSSLSTSAGDKKKGKGGQPMRQPIDLRRDAKLEKLASSVMIGKGLRTKPYVAGFVGPRSIARLTVKSKAAQANLHQVWGEDEAPEEEPSHWNLEGEEKVKKLYLPPQKRQHPRQVHRQSLTSLTPKLQRSMKRRKKRTRKTSVEVRGRVGVRLANCSKRRRS